MPGIVGIISQRGGEECEALVKAMIESMRHEPFYKSGVFSCAKLGIHAGWIAHEQSFAAQQIFCNASQDVILLFSGECFSGFDMHGRAAGEGSAGGKEKGDWLVSAYEEHGQAFFGKVNGYFSGLLIDKRRKAAFLFNDRYGVERIYWHKTSDAFYFASEAKALLRVLPQLREFDTDGVAQFLSFGCTLGTRTLFRGIETLPPAGLWSFQGEECKKDSYFSPTEWETQEALSPESFQEQFSATFRQVLPRYLPSHRPLGISLTAGLDSRMIMACLGDTNPPPVCYTFSGEKRDPLDARIAARVATACGLEHSVLRLEGDFFKNFSANADRTVHLSDGTVGIVGTHEIYFNRKARQLSPVRLTGVFGGEIMRGVSFFKPRRVSQGLLNPEFQQAVMRVRETPFENRQNPISFAAFTETPLRRYGVPTVARSQVIFRTPYLDNDFVALCYRAPKPATGHSADVALHLIRTNNPILASIATDRGYLGGRRTALRKMLAETIFKADYFYSEGLPPRATRLDPLFRLGTSALGIAGQHKFLYYRAWFQRELGSYLLERLADLSARSSQFWNTTSVEAIFHAHRLGHANHLTEINDILTLDAVERLLLKHASPEEGEVSDASGLTTANASR